MNKIKTEIKSELLENCNLKIQKIHQINDSRYIVITCSRYITGATNISLWKHNRPPDKLRCEEINRSIDKYSFCEGFIYLAYQNKHLYCYDGAHRLLTITEYLKKKQNIFVYVSILYNPTDGEIVDHFKDLNQCVPVPDIYVRDVTQEKKNIIEAVCDYYYNKYQPLFRPSRNPNAPHENRDMMKMKLEQIYDNKDEVTDENDMFFILSAKNDYIKDNKPRKSSQKQIEKCEEYDFYLFLDKNWHTNI